MQFEVWGWRIPFLVSIVLLGISVYIRLQLQESPAFLEIKKEGKLSKAPLNEAFGNWSNLQARAARAVRRHGRAGGGVVRRAVLCAVLPRESPAGGCHGRPNLIIAAALAIGTPFFVVFGSLSDRIGRKPIVMAGCVLAALTYFPAFKALTHFANPALERAVAQRAGHRRWRIPADCSFQFDPVGRKAFTQSCDVAKSALATAGVPYENEAAPAGTRRANAYRQRRQRCDARFVRWRRAWTRRTSRPPTTHSAQLKGALATAGYPAKANPARSITRW